MRFMRIWTFCIAIIWILIIACSYDVDITALVKQEVTIPEVVFSSVRDGEQDVNPRPDIVIRFSQKMDTVVSGQYISFTKGGIDPVGFSMMWSADKREVTVSPDDWLGLDTPYVIKIDNKVVSAGAYTMVADHLISFLTTGVDVVPPEITGTGPIAGDVKVAGDRQIVVWFNEPMAEAAVEAAFGMNDGDGAAVSGSFSWLGNNLIFEPAERLDSWETYRVTVGTGARDLAGNPLAMPYTFGFSTFGSYIYKEMIGSYSKHFFDKPLDVACYDLNGESYVLVCDTMRNAVVKYRLNRIAGQPDVSYQYISSFGAYGLAAGFFSYPMGIEVDGDATAYVVDLMGRIQLFDHDENLLANWNTFVSFTNDSSGLAIGSDGFVYTAINDRVKKISSAGVLSADWTGFGSPDGMFDSPLGIASDEAGYLYVADTNNHLIRKLTTDGSFVSSWGGFGSGDGQFNKPEGVTVDGDGRVYVSDTANHRIQQFDEEGTFVSAFGSFGGADGEFMRPVGLDADSSGNLIIADSFNRRVQKFDGDGNFMVSWGAPLSGNQVMFDKPVDIAIDASGNFFVSNYMENEILKFDRSGELLLRFGGFGSGDGEFTGPTGILAAGNGDLFVIDYVNSRVCRFDGDGNWISSFGSYGSGAGEFSFINGAALFQDLCQDNSGDLYVVDTGNHRVQKFGADGTFLLAWGTYGTGFGEFLVPTSIAVDSKNRVYVVDTGNNRIQVFEADGTYVDTFGSLGAGLGAFSLPEGIAIDASDDIFVSEVDNDRVQVFDSSGNVITSFGSYGSGAGELYDPMGLAVGADGDVFVVDMGNHRVQVFMPVSW